MPSLVHMPGGMATHDIVRGTENELVPASYGRQMSSVRCLVAWCELGSEDGLRVSFVVHELADLADGRRLTLHRDRGFSTQLEAVGAHGRAARRR
jgi:hypothetical protein